MARCMACFFSTSFPPQCSPSASAFLMRTMMFSLTSGRFAGGLAVSSITSATFLGSLGAFFLAAGFFEAPGQTEVSGQRCAMLADAQLILDLRSKL